MTPLLEVDHVGFVYAETPIFSRVDFSIAPASLLAIVGPNGSGKTTLLRVMAGLLRPTAGEVRLQNLPLPSWPRRELAKHLAFLPQSLTVGFPFTVEEVVARGRTPYHSWFARWSGEDRHAVENALADTDLLHLRDRRIPELSGGEFQRVKIALALVQGGKLLLLDEPLQQLDIGRQLELLDLLLRLRNRGFTIIAAMHELELVSRYFPNTLLLTPGGRYQFGNTANVLTPGNLAEAFQVRAPMARGIGNDWLPQAEYGMPEGILFEHGNDSSA